MAFTNIYGAETGAFGATEECSVLGTAPTAQTSIKRTGDYAVRVNPTTTATSAVQIPISHTATGIRLVSAGSFATGYFRCYIYIATLPTAAEEICTVGSTKFQLRLDQNAKISAFDSTATSLGLGSTVLSTATWYRIELKVGTGASAAWEVLINGTSELSGSTANLNTGNPANFNIGKVTNRNGSGYDVYFDDCAISDSAYPGAGAVACLRPTGNGNYTAWTGTYTDVDDLTSQAGHDTDTTFISSSTNTQAETVTLENCSDRSISGTINAVKSVIVTRDVTNTTNIQQRTRVTSPGTADTDLSLYDSAGTYVILANVLSVNPSGSAAWTTAGVDSLEVGIVHSQANAREARCTMICAMVDYTAASGPTDAATGAAAQAAAGTEAPSSTLATSGAVVNAAAGTISVFTPDVTRAATGAAVNVAAGTETPSLSLAATGAAVNASAGTLLAPRELAVTGAVVNAAAGSPGVTRDPATLTGATVNASAGTPVVSPALAGASVTIAVGTPGVTRDPATLVGATINVSAGTPVASSSLSVLTGTTANASAGTAVASWSKAGSGATATTAAGTLSIQTAITLSGATAYTVSGNVVAPGETIRPTTGVAANASSGTLVSQSSLTLTGAVENSAAGSLGIGRTTSLSGATATATSGTVTPAAGFTALLSGATANAAVGSVTALNAVLSGATVNVSVEALLAQTSVSALNWAEANARAGQVIFQLQTVYEGTERHGGVRPVLDTWRKRRLRDLRSIGTK